MNNFLLHIWGQNEINKGYRCITTNPNGIIRNDFFTSNYDIDEHVSGCQYDDFIHNSSVDELDVWYAPSLFYDEKRGKDRVESVRALWLDIDVKEGSYKSGFEAAADIITFVDNTKLPIPTLISSGNGLHVYWVLDKPFDRSDEWFEYANGLREACLQFGLKADHSITIDIARILRVPGTKNWKDKTNPKPVEIYGEIRPYATKEALFKALEPFILKYRNAQAAKEFNKQFETDLPDTPCDAEQVANKCPQMTLMRKEQGNIPEPQWYAGLGVLAKCIDGESIAHNWSKGYTKYSEKETGEKFERAKEFSPTTCARFESVAPEICRSCPHFGKIVTPCQLGATVTKVEIAVERPTENPQVQEKRELPVAYGYEVGKEGVFKAGSEDDERKCIFTQPVWVSRVMVAEHGAGSEVELIWLNSMGRIRTASFKQSLLAQDSVFAGWLLDNNIHGFFQIKHVIQYVRAGIQTISRKFDEEIVYTQFGLCESGFVIGNDLVSEKGLIPVRISEEVDRKKVKLMNVKGSLNDWVEATKLFNQPQFWMHRFSVLSALGSPLLSLINSEGSVLSLAGESSGGKTTAANFGASAYGDHKAFTIDPQSTLNAFYESWRISGGLPLICNEAATINPYHLKELVYAAANGKARDRLKRDGKMKASGNWQTLTVFTSNTHLMALSDKILSEATRRRILELSFDVENKIPLEIGQQLNRVIKENHGHAGRKFLEFAIANREIISSQIRKRVDDLQKGIDSVHRYNIWLISVASVTAEIAQSLGLIKFDVKDAIERTIATLQGQAIAQISTVDRVEEAIAEYVNQFAGSITGKIPNTNLWADPYPRGELKGRYNLDKTGEVAELCLPVKLFKEWSLQRNIDTNHVKQYLKENSINSQLVRLGERVQPISCYIIPQKREVENEGK